MEPPIPADCVLDEDTLDDFTLPKPNAVMSLYGSGNVERDRARRATAKSMISPPEGGEDRPQNIQTPQMFLDCLSVLWPEGIALDPCWSPDCLVQADETYSVEQGKDGTSLAWKPRTFFNPPYKTLSVWLAKFRTEAESGVQEIAGLIPVRTHRAWWRRVAKDVCDKVIWLDPLSFRGYKQSFPAPLCVFYKGERGDKIEAAFRPLSKE